MYHHEVMNEKMIIIGLSNIHFFLNELEASINVFKYLISENTRYANCIHNKLLSLDNMGCEAIGININIADQLIFLHLDGFRLRKPSYTKKKVGRV